MRTYEAGQAGITVNQAWKPRVLRRLASCVVDNLMKNLRNVAPGAGFEPAWARSPPALQAGPLGRSGTPAPS